MFPVKILWTDFLDIPFIINNFDVFNVNKSWLRKLNRFILKLYGGTFMN